MVNPSYIPTRGDIVWITLDPQKGHEQAGRRPSLVLSSRSYNERVGLTLICPITSQAKGYPFEVLLDTKGKEIAGVVMADQIRIADWRVREASFIEKTSRTVLEHVIMSLISLLTE